ncbi:MAG: hypothetical protein F6K35_43475, partial [Okeania sp. SIO2H7]|nr:hypothetical protein [Okeania sp. SIO2H7]
MRLIPILQLNQKLLTGTAILGLGSIVAGAIGGPVLSGIANFTAGMVGNNLGALVEKLRNSRDVLRNQDLAKAAGRSVGLALGKISSDFPEIQEPLKALAQKTEGYWLEWAEGAKTLKLFESLREEQLVNVFANDPQEFAEYRVLEKEEWRVVVTWLFQRGCEKGVLFPSGSLEEDFGDVIDALAGELEGNFQKNLREVLKDDAANGGEAFAGMLLDLHGATLGQIAEIKQALSGLATRKDMCLLLQAIERLSQPKSNSSATVLPSLGAVDTVPKLPPHFLPRPEDLQELKGRLLAPATQTVVMTGQPRQVGLQGMGGIGKTVLAAAVARDKEVRERFRH